MPALPLPSRWQHLRTHKTKDLASSSLAPEVPDIAVTVAIQFHSEEVPKPLRILANQRGVLRVCTLLITVTAARADF